jgi:hypothetical protein
VEVADRVQVDANDADDIDDENVAGEDEACGVEVLEVESAAVS